MADKTHFNGPKHKAALDEFAEVGVCGRKNGVECTLMKMRMLMHFSMYLSAPMSHFLFLMMCRSRRRQGRNLGSQVFANQGVLQCLDRFHCQPFSFTIANVDPDITGKRVGETIIQLFSWHWPWDYALILPIVASVVHTTILSIVNAVIVGLPDPSQTL
jgi:hypothetical protein